MAAARRTRLTFRPIPPVGIEGADATLGAALWGDTFEDRVLGWGSLRRTRSSTPDVRVPADRCRPQQRGHELPRPARETPTHLGRASAVRRMKSLFASARMSWHGKEVRARCRRSPQTLCEREPFRQTPKDQTPSSTNGSSTPSTYCNGNCAGVVAAPLLSESPRGRGEWPAPYYGGFSTRTRQCLQKRVEGRAPTEAPALSRSRSCPTGSPLRATTQPCYAVACRRSASRNSSTSALCSSNNPGGIAP